MPRVDPAFRNLRRADLLQIGILAAHGQFQGARARNALLQLDEPRRERGVVAASAGNHALGLAYHGQLLGIGVTVVMPRFAPLIKVSTCRRLGARIILHGETYPEATRFAHELADREGLTYLHGFNDPAIIAGQGTLGLEVLEQVPDVEAIVVPIGGAGLIAGIATAVKSVKSEVRIFGVEAEEVPTFTRRSKPAGRSIFRSSRRLPTGWPWGASVMCRSRSPARTSSASSP